MHRFYTFLFFPFFSRFSLESSASERCHWVVCSTHTQPVNSHKCRRHTNTLPGTHTQGHESVNTDTSMQRLHLFQLKKLEKKNGCENGSEWWQDHISGIPLIPCQVVRRGKALASTVVSITQGFYILLSF